MPNYSSAAFKTWLHGAIARGDTFTTNDKCNCPVAKWLNTKVYY